MIVGLGIDVVEIGRIASLMRRYGRRFLSRILTPDEIEVCLSRSDPAPHVAGRFAAKEAALKALATGMFSGISFKEVIVLAGAEGPRLILSGRALERAKSLTAISSRLSISHDGGLAVAVVVLEGS